MAIVSCEATSNGRKENRNRFPTTMAA
uniref:Uncharacterized protein n=1 Tax=Rhizophora mucronata TaxID=61149 RepID=A0A2P2P151_RHIMU